MHAYKEKIINNICYTELVYGRINKKLNLQLSKQKIEFLVSKILLETDESGFCKKGKNIYVINTTENIRLTINYNTNRIITADNLSEKKNQPRQK
ncbi:DUF3781 domain-containing protein [Tenacibaculum sp. SG-28]|uniref:DUF3781 domain-containing protein n=1 Tax=Tenacibaculum sp. SG-28 TaxID=754426 RepID=UPI000CF50FB2|nr:DUF3781 domain-containing protein [Tenacibaculum sp. SG-28]PQJ20622.1 hypothetical protein BSU00_09930 [Tenacibaculum sp. SG-28]